MSYDSDPHPDDFKIIELYEVSRSLVEANLVAVECRAPRFYECQCGLPGCKVFAAYGVARFPQDHETFKFTPTSGETPMPYQLVCVLSLVVPQNGRFRFYGIDHRDSPDELAMIMAKTHPAIGMTLDYLMKQGLRGRLEEVLAEVAEANA